MNPALRSVLSASWQALGDAVGNGEHPLRYLVVCNAAGASPQARILVLRDADATARVLEFHTDTRSAKWSQLAVEPKVSVVGYHPEDRIQLRMTGMVGLFASATDIAQHRWNALPLWTRQTYCCDPPGRPIASPEAVEKPLEPTLQDTNAGRQNFGVLRVHVETLDWVALSRGANRRAQFQFASGDQADSGTWVNP